MPDCIVLYQVDWDPTAFFQEQDYGCGTGEAFRKAMTLTGIPNEAEGLACEEYICRTWPQTGAAFLELMQLVLTSKEAQKNQSEFYKRLPYPLPPVHIWL